jgi:hypothetical protein
MHRARGLCCVARQAGNLLRIRKGEGEKSWVPAHQVGCEETLAPFLDEYPSGDTGYGVVSDVALTVHGLWVYGREHACPAHDQSDHDRSVL